jgi:hypothetical protein
VGASPFLAQTTISKVKGAAVKRYLMTTIDLMKKKKRQVILLREVKMIINPHLRRWK